MKNLFVSTAFVLFTLSLFSCDQTNDPQPNSQSQTQDMAQLQSPAGATTAQMQVGKPITDRMPVPYKFEWQLVKTATVPYNKGLKLTSPYSIVNEDAGDISWGTDGGCYSAIKSWTVSQVSLKLADVKTVTPDYLKTLTFTKWQLAWAPTGSLSWTNYIPDGTVIAYKTSTGKFYLVVVKSSFPLVLDIYHEHYYQVF